MFAIRKFKFFGFVLGRTEKEFISVSMESHGRKPRRKLGDSSLPGANGSIIRAMERIKVYMRGWLNYYGIADMKNNIESMNGWLYRRIRMCI